MILNESLVVCTNNSQIQYMCDKITCVHRVNLRLDAMFSNSTSTLLAPSCLVETLAVKNSIQFANIEC